MNHDGTLRNSDKLCKCGNPASRATHVMFPDGHVDWDYQCVNCWYEAEDIKWHGKTCGECGYFWYTDTVSDSECNTRMLVDCGCSKWSRNRPTEPHTPACPDFVAREVEDTE